jgi:hypothetical protein
MIDLREFYKDYYDKTLEWKDEINNSLSMPIGIITALIAALFYVLTNFDFQFSRSISIAFVSIALTVVFLIGCSVYHLIRTLSDFHDGYSYAYIDNTDVLHQYYESLVQYYIALPGNTEASSIKHAKTKFSDHITQRLINCAYINQNNNNAKNLRRYKCHRFIIYSIIALCLLNIVFYVNFVLN